MSHFGRLLPAALLLLPWVPSPAGAADDPEPPTTARSEMKRLEGTYEVVSFQRDGTAFARAELDTMKVTIKGAECSFSQGPTVYTSTMTVAPTKKLKQVDCTYTNSFVKGSTVKGLYRFDKDQITFCYGPPGGGRPADFTAPAGSSQTLYVLKRVKPKK